MSQLARLFFSVTSLFCGHEWARRVEGKRVYLECVHCLSTTPGLDMSQTQGARAGTTARRAKLLTIRAS